MGSLRMVPIVPANLSEPAFPLNHSRLLDFSSDFNDTAFNITSAYSTPVSIVLGILTVATSVITIVGNLLVLTSFLVERSLRTASNYFIASLAATDVLIGIFSMNFYTLYLVLGRWPLGELSCDLWLTLDYTACLTSQYTVLFITADRFFSVRLPAKYRNWRTDRKVIMMVAITWIVPTLVFCPIIMVWPFWFKERRAPEKCYAEFANDPIFNTIFTVCYFWVTLCVMFGLYAGIYRVAASLQKRSDEKRDRVSGLLTPARRYTQLGVTGMNGDDTKGRNQYAGRNQTRSGQYHSDNNTCPNESSGFDSDEEIRQPVKKANVETKPIVTASPQRTVQIEPRRSITTDQLLPLFPRNDLSIALQAPKPKPVIVKRKVSTENRCVPTKVHKKTASSRCPVHCSPEKTNPKNCALETCAEVPTPVGSPQIVVGYGQILSPLLTDDESGVELSSDKFQALVKVNMPPSPTLCICSDVEEEALQLKSRPTEVGLSADAKAASNNAHSSPKKREALDEILKRTEKPAETDESGDDSDNIFAQTEKQEETCVDEGYENRVLESFNRRLAAVQEHIGLANPHPKTMPTVESGINSRSPEKFHPANPGIEKHNCQSAEKQFDKGSNTSPIWKRQLIVQNGFCPLHQCPCTMPSNPYMDYQHDCLICSGQLESDTLQSSSSGTDFPVIGMVNLSNRHYCCRTDTDYRSTDAHMWSSTEKNRVVICLMRLGNVVNWPRRLLDWFRQMVQRRTEKRSLKRPKERGRRENRARKALRTITFILGAFVLCWTPYHIVIIIKGICDDTKNDTTCVNDILFSVTYWLCYMNSPINPFCYALANAQFKKTFIRILHGDFRRT